ncbi:tRNA (N6-threonylcarbamoyladenosine(37)-N6)-methyltransferase TrmO [Desulfotomaculum copahuensis]|uniref:tRNA-Thr(GGU) m(6)t(6)A37 methyltransferase TsaA n=1 Tax=Desulfotomaculum copahuensis TaxID=1838280 RepID=A0A1B7LDZ8_9FIRM|nr:tRNA (N6-threonylcarbamoyladenosine(37)-N6)-methyltransferase TrmO [Desulfotomaculum copahuensis]OAT81319.1 tRNA-Thr(GGU) m(6)t(6)A37 methyltransferase TsaA [Desulfotomaculum copahuensis]
MELKPVGTIHSPFKASGEAPHQGRHTQEISILEVFDQFAPGLKDVEEASHLIVLYWCDRADREKLQGRTPFGPEIRGVFACRSPGRPNPVAFCVAKLLKREGNRLYVRGLDALDQSPLVDIKPYSAGIDSYPDAGINWFERAGAKK